MFPNRHHRPTPRHPFHGQMPRHHFHRTPSKQENSPLLQVMNQFKDDNGQYDFAKISEVISQMNKVYDDISPMIRRFTKK